MKKILLFGATVLMSASAFSQSYDEPYVIEDLLSMSISPNGTYTVVQDELGNSAVINTNNQGMTYYAGNMPGNGNCLSNDGVLVGQTMEGIASVMRRGIAQTPASLASYTQSSINAITPDGTRVCGYMANTGLGPYDVPFYCDIDANGTFGMPITLPYPVRDFFGNVPQFVTAVWISDDGRTIIGQVQDSTGFYTSPIVYTQDIEGKWTYSQPSQSLFNPDNLEMPKWPTFNKTQPNVTEFMSLENAQKWAKALSDYENGLSSVDPWDSIVPTYMTQEEYLQYEEALGTYKQELQEYYKEIDEYWEQMAKVNNDSSFALGVMALNPQGTIMVGCRMITNPEDGITDVAEGYHVYIFNLEDDTFRSVVSKYGMLVPNQILEDGTIIAIDRTTYADYVLLPAADDFIPFPDYISTIHPGWLPWMQSNLQTRIDSEVVISSGILSFSRDLTTMVGGYLGSNGMFSYIFKGELAGVEGIAADNDGHTVVYDLYGRKVLDTLNPDDVNGLAKGIYIINGKKVALK